MLFITFIGMKYTLISQKDSSTERNQTDCQYILKRKFENLLERVTGFKIIIFTLVLQVM